MQLLVNWAPGRLQLHDGRRLGRSWPLGRRESPAESRASLLALPHCSCSCGHCRCTNKNWHSFWKRCLWFVCLFGCHLQIVGIWYQFIWSLLSGFAYRSDRFRGPGRSSRLTMYNYCRKLLIYLSTACLNSLSSLSIKITRRFFKKKCNP